MGVLYLTKKDLDKYQRIVNKYAPYPTEVRFEDDYKISSYTTYKDKKATITISTFVSAFYHFDDLENGREVFSDAILFHELGHLLYTNYNQLNESDSYLLALEKELYKAYQDYWDDSNNLESYQTAFVLYYFYQTVQSIHSFIEDAAIENSFFKEFPQYSDNIIYARKKITEYQVLENIYTKQKGFPLLLEHIHHYVCCFYKQQVAPIELEKHKDSNTIKELLIDARLHSKDTKQRIDITKVICNILKEEIEAEAIKFFLENYRHRYGELEKMTGIGNDSMLGSEETEEKKEQFQIVEDNREGIVCKEETDIDIEELMEEDHSGLSTMQNKVRKHISNEKEKKDLPNYTLIRKDELMVEAKQNAYLVQKRIVHKKRTQFKKKLDYGSRLDSKQLYRAKIDGRVYQISKKSKKTNVVVSILVDSSFSMQGKRQKMAIETAYKLGVMFQDLRIPFCIHGHSVGDDDITDFINYVSYDHCFIREALDEVFYLNTTGFTHEYIALKESLKDLSMHKRGTQKGLVIVISDAETESKQEIKEMCQRYKRIEDIDVLCIAVGKLGEVSSTYENYIYLPTTEHFFQSLVKEFERLAI